MPAPLGFVLAFVVFIIVVAIIILGIRWLIKKAGGGLDPELSVILSLVLVLVVILVFFYAVPWHSWGINWH